MAVALLNVTIIGMALTILVVCVIAFVAFTVGGSIVAWVTPRIQRIQKGEPSKKKATLCCPPGIGCNDPTGKMMSECRRDVARKSANPEQLVELEEAWSTLCGTSPKRRSAFKAALAKYSEVRDRIIAQKIRDSVADAGMNAANVLSSGEVLDGEDDVPKSRNMGQSAPSSRHASPRYGGDGAY